MLEEKIFINRLSDEEIVYKPKLCPWNTKLPPNLNIINPVDKKEAICTFYRTIQVDQENILHIYTDGSKSAEGVGCGWFFNLDGKKICGQIKLPKYSTIFQAEAIAITETLAHCNQLILNNELKKEELRIFSDSWSVLTALEHYSVSSEVEIRQLHKIIEHTPLKVNLQWIPGHRDIDGNEIVDLIAKEAVTKGIGKCVPRSMNTVKTELFQLSWKIWSDRWMKQKSNSYCLLTIPSKNHLALLRKNLSLTEQSLLSQFRSGHTDLNSTTHRFLKSPSGSNRCKCGSIESVSHVLLDCWLYHDIRKSLKDDIYKTTKNRKIGLTLLLDDPKIIHLTLWYLDKILTRRNTL